MAVDDTVADGEPESGPFFLGREEGVEYILDVLLFDPLAAILAALECFRLHFIMVPGVTFTSW